MSDTESVKSEVVMPEPATFPNQQYELTLTGEKREKFFECVKETYQQIKEAGFNVPQVTLKEKIEGERDTTYLEYEPMYGDNIKNLVAKGKMTEEKAREVRKKAIEMVDAIREKLGLSIYNVHSANIFYNTENKKTYLFDLIQTSKNLMASQVVRHTEEYKQYLAQIETDRKAQEEAEKKKEETSSDDESDTSEPPAPEGEEGEESEDV